MNVLFLTCALALPSATESNYGKLKIYMERHFPDETIVFVHRDERMLSAERTPFIYDGLRIWTVRKAA